MSCAYFSECRRKCHAVYGKLEEDCLPEELQEKRCLSIKHCPRDAQKYYGAAMEGLPKALCSSWAEAFAYGNTNDRNKDGASEAAVKLRHGEKIVEHHLKAQKQVNASPNLKKECRQIARDLAKCLKFTNVTRN